MQGRKISGFLQVAVGLYRYQSIDFPNKQSAEKIVDNIDFEQIWYWVSFEKILDKYKTIFEDIQGLELHDVATLMSDMIPSELWEHSNVLESIDFPNKQ